MALIPLKQEVTIIKAASDQLDIYGNPIEGEHVVYKCRIDEQSERVQAQNGEDAVASASIMIAGLVDVDYNDYVQYTDELGRVTKKRPLRIEVVRAFNSKKVYFTVVYI